jgi:hypothetical protein
MAAPTAAALENWAYIHPDAAYDLLAWTKDNPSATHAFSDWGKTNNKRSKLFVTWAITHPGNDIDDFVETHHDWRDLGSVLRRHRIAARRLLAWCRHYPGAARALIQISPTSRVQQINMK